MRELKSESTGWIYLALLPECTALSVFHPEVPCTLAEGSGHLRLISWMPLAFPHLLQSKPKPRLTIEVGQNSEETWEQDALHADAGEVDGRSKGMASESGIASGNQMGPFVKTSDART